jgi:hypothetical protein
MVKLFSAGPESKYAIEELDKATQYYTGNPNAKYSDLKGKENKPLRVKIRKLLEYRGGVFVEPGTMVQDSEKMRTATKLQEFLKGKTTIKQSALVKKMEELGYKNPKIQANNIIFDNPEITMIRDMPKDIYGKKESKLYPKSELDKATRGENKKNPDRITKTKFDELSRSEKSKIFTRLRQQGGKYSPFKKINDPLPTNVQKDIKTKFANLYDDWDFKNFKFGVSNLEENANVYNKVVNFVKEGKPYELAADLKSADGWMGAQMDRAFRLGDNRYEPIRKMVNNKSKIIGFIDNTDFGGGNKYMFAEKFITGSNADGVLMSSHPDYLETKKFRDVANFAKLPVRGALKNILQNKGIDTSKISLSDLYKYMMGEVGIEGTKNAIEQHHISGVGVRATGDYQLLNRDLNALARDAVKEIEAGNLKRVPELEKLGVQVKVDDVLFGSGSGKASSDLLKIQGQVTDFYRGQEGETVLNRLFSDFRKDAVNNGPICSLVRTKKANGGTIRCVDAVEEAIQNDPEKLVRDASRIDKFKNSATKFLQSPFVRGTGKFGALAAAGAATAGAVKKFMNDDPTTYLSNEDQQKNMLISMITDPVVDEPKSDAAILDYQLPVVGAGAAAGTAAVAPSTIEAARSGALGAKKSGITKTGLKTLGRGLAALGTPAALLATEPLFIGGQIAEGDSLGEIATDPINYLGAAFTDPAARFATKGVSPGIAKAMRLGISPSVLKTVSRRFGLPGLALSLGISGYETFDDYRNKRGFFSEE